MPKLHELLAVEKDRATVATNMMAEAAKVFAAGTHFHGHVKTWTYQDEGRAFENRTEQKRVDETVPSKLDWVHKHLRRFLDVRYQIDLANSTAVANLVVDGKTVAAGVPVSYLLMLEARLVTLRETYKAIPTHAPGIEWVADREQSDAGDIFKSKNPRVEFITEKKVLHEIIVPATEHHPAQVASHSRDERVGKSETVQFSSTVTPADKADMLARIDALMLASKRARQRANTVEAPKARIGAALLDYIKAGTLTGAASSPEDAQEV